MGNIPVCLPRDGNGTARWEAIWVTGRDESPRFLGGTGSWNRSGTGREIGREHGREIDPEHSWENGRELSRENGLEHSWKIGRERSRVRAGICNPEWLGTRY